ncbi:transglutaminase domain-containing protein [Candidatus Shapirobacteria bacterium]|nr:transglutaminase domain-containing protein [Candidatus Shapirobacteria bacterium]
MPKLFNFFLISLLALVFFPSSVLAAGEFGLSQNITYQFDQNGNAQVSQEVTLENKLANIYAAQYKITISGGALQNIKAIEDNQELRVEIKEPQRDLTEVTVFFDQPVAGLGKKRQFSLQYFLPDYAKKEGQTWRVLIPKINDLENLEELIININVPQCWGPLSFVSPKNYTQSTEGERQIVTFSKNQLGEKEVMLIFGQTQTFHFSLNYYLKNSDAQERIQALALLPDTSYQKIFLTKIDPEPLDVEADGDGNWLASYLVAPNSSLAVKAEGLAQISSQPLSPPIAPEDLNQYLAAKKYWEKDSPQFQSLAQKLKTPEEIYQFVLATLDYNLDKVKNRQVQRQGALTAFNNPDQAICTEFTDLFIALARAAGIPSRELNGYAYSTNPELLPLTLDADVLHAWPEYWDQKRQTWIQVDPTWENTSGIDYFNKLDMSHLVFVIHGLDSVSPPPAGAYQDPSLKNQKSVEVEFSLSPQVELLPLAIDFSLPEKISFGQKESGEIIIRNINPVAFYNQQVKISSEEFSLEGIQKTIKILPPYAKETFTVNISNQHLLKENVGKILVQVGNQEKAVATINFTSPLASPLFLNLLIALAVLVVAGIIIYLFKSLKKSN